MFHFTRPQSTLFLVIIAIMAFLLLLFPTPGSADSDKSNAGQQVGKNLQAALAEVKIPPRALRAQTKPQQINWYKNSNPTSRDDKTKTPQTDIFFAVEREITFDADTVKSSAGVEINW